MSNVVGLITGRKQDPAPSPGPPGPPFLLTSADNGLSVDPVSGRIVLGNDVGLLTAVLLSNRDLPMSGFNFRWLDGVNRQLTVEPTIGFYGLGDIDSGTTGTRYIIDGPTGTHDMTGNFQSLLEADPTRQTFGDCGNNQNFQKIDIDQVAMVTRITRKSAALTQDDVLLLDSLNEIYALGDIDGSITGEQLFIDAANRSGWIGTGPGNRNVSVDQINSLYSIGDIDGSGNSTALVINDFSKISSLGDNIGIGQLLIDGVNMSAVMNVGGQAAFSLDAVSRIYQIGDIGGLGSNTVFKIDDTAQQVNVNFGGLAPQLLLKIDGFSIGDINGAFGSGNFNYDNASLDFQMVDGAGGMLLDLNGSTDIYKMGDISGAHGSIQLQVDGGNARFNMDNAAHNTKIRINGVNGFTGTVGPVITSITVNGGIVTNVT